MDRHYAMELLREAVRQPRLLATRAKFWKPELFEHFLERCNELSFRAPREGLALARHAPAYAAKVCAANPECSSPTLMLQAYAYLGSAYRRVCDYERSEVAFQEALKYRTQAPAPVVAELFLRLAYLRIAQLDPEAFQLIEEAIAILKRGNLVDRHDLGRCLLCRGFAFFDFKQPGKSLEDFTAALNHLSLRKSPRPYYAALHNLATWAVDHGNREQLETAMANLKPSLSILHSYNRRHYAKLKHRWLIALVDARLDHDGAAELAYLEIQAGFERLGMLYEVGMVAIDRALLYRKQGRLDELKTLAAETAAVFRRIGTEPAAREALDLWRRADVREVRAEGFLERLRDLFARHTEAMPAPAT